MGKTSKAPGQLQLPEGEPSVIADAASVTYHVYSSGKAVIPGRKRQDREKIRKVEAVKSVSFAVTKGESVGIIGTNGSGKSSLLRAIAGLTPISGGDIFASSQPSLLGVGAALIPALSGEKNIVLGCLALGFSMDEVNEKYDEIVAFAELEEFIDMPMRTYSSGMAARLKFAIASSRDHDILIVDEALSVGDQRFRKKSEARIRQLRDHAGTVFLVSHQMGSIRDTCDRVIWLNRGTLMMDGPTKEVTTAYEKFLKKQ